MSDSENRISLEDNSDHPMSDSENKENVQEGQQEGQQAAQRGKGALFRVRAGPGVNIG